MSFLLDTNVICEIRRGSKTNPQVKAWQAPHPPECLFLSVITMGEIRKGVETARRKDEAKALVLEGWLRSLEFEFEDRILAVDAEIADLWGRLLARYAMSPMDGLISATAACYGYTVVTRNERDFQRCGVDFINPFKA